MRALGRTGRKRRVGRVGRQSDYLRKRTFEQILRVGSVGDVGSVPSAERMVVKLQSYGRRRAEGRKVDMRSLTWGGPWSVCVCAFHTRGRYRAVFIPRPL
ncbi:hypothetical protein J6590_024118 [Homalodisca vitripennis]|nr:hypothetical protein J6590_024118 [Homalodisca vitripennis]